MRGASTHFDAPDGQRKASIIVPSFTANEQTSDSCAPPTASQFVKLHATTLFVRPFLRSNSTRTLEKTTNRQSLATQIEHSLARSLAKNKTKHTQPLETVPPQPPVLSAPSVPGGSASAQHQVVAREGQEFSLQCTSFGGNPEPNITWFRNGDPMVATSGAGGPRIEQTRHISNATNAAAGTTTSSLLTWIPTLDDHQATYKCLVSNKAMLQQPAYERELTLAVECKYTGALASFSLSIPHLNTFPLREEANHKGRPKVASVRTREEMQMRERASVWSAMRMKQWISLKANGTDARIWRAKNQQLAVA